jgi:protein-tyrosine phosphatase
LMVCHGNICRSPMAEAVTRALIEQGGLAGMVTVASAGTSAEHEGQGMDARAAAALRRRGWPIPRHQAHQLRPEEVEPGALVLCADRANLRAVERLGLDAEVRLLRSYDPSARRGDEVPDPWFGEDPAFDEALDLIERACRGLVKALGTQTSSEPGTAAKPGR